MVNGEELKKLGLFGSLSQTQLAKLAGATETIKYPANSSIYMSRERAARLFIVRDGLVSLRLFDPGEGPEVNFGTRAKGDLFGGASFMKPQRYTVTATCLKPTELIVIETSHLWDFFQDDPEFGYRFMKEIAQLYFDRYVTAIGYLAESIKEPTRIMAQPG
ncbi:MAG: cyclic nucleotide-binding domain-containing protein [Desulfobacterales bacterium]|nr:cyclic nucleotide-binding domain-containing protein [Desulfobacterales bacterium]